MAREHFFEKGFDGASMSAIAAQLGGSKTTLWSYFASKEVLFAAIVKDAAQTIRSRMIFVDRGDMPIDRIANLGAFAMEHLTSPMAIHLLRLMSSQAERFPDLAKAVFDLGPVHLRSYIADYLRDNFSAILWTDDYARAAKDLLALSMSEYGFEGPWFLSRLAMEEKKAEFSRCAATRFLCLYAVEPRRYVPADTQWCAACARRTADPIERR